MPSSPRSASVRLAPETSFAPAIAKEISTSGSPIPAPACVICGGEPTVTIRGKGKGGRNQEIANTPDHGTDPVDDILQAILEDEVVAAHDRHLDKHAREELADLYERADRRREAIEQLEALAALEPALADRLVGVGLAYARWRRAVSSPSSRR